MTTIMADEATRRREIRRRKILESSEARLKKITSSNSKKLQDECFCHGGDKKTNEITKNPNSEDDTLSDMCGIRMKREDFSVDSESNNSNDRQNYDDQGTRYRLSEQDSLRLNSSNGDFARSSSPDSYTFPKKVSDAETRSFGRTRSDVRRNSSCTQIVMETLQFSSFSLTNLRFWIVAMAAIAVKLCLMLEFLPVFQTIFFPFLMLEVAIFSWSRFESQVCSRPVASPVISSVLLLCGLSSSVISGFNSVSNFIHCSVQDFCVYLFSFVFLNFICEMSM